LNHGHAAGHRPTHTKGIVLAGRFTPAAEARSLTLAPHVQHGSTPVTIRFSNATGLPAIPDTDPNASPRGMAVRFHLAEHVHTDIIAHSVNGFPARTVEEFLELLHAIIATGPDSPHPTPIEAFLGTHPAALAFVQAPKPVPVSFFKQSFYAVNADRFTNAAGASRYGRYRIRPEGGTEYLDADGVAKQQPDFLFDDVKQRLLAGPVKMHVAVQLAADGDIVNDATVQWPDGRPEIEFGTIEVMNVLQNNEAEQRQIIFDPIPRVDGIDPSDDPLLEPRAAVYLMSGRRRRAGR
jgi:catalase